MKKLPQVAAIILGVTLLVGTGNAKAFSDVSEADKNYHAIQYLTDTGVFQGYEDGTFRPDQPINRAELLKIVVSSLGYDSEASKWSNCFIDVKNDWYAPYVCYAKYAKGWIDGYPDGTFKPDQTVNRVEGIKILANAYAAFGVPKSATYSLPYTDVDSAAWYAPYLNWAASLNLLEKTSGAFGPSEGMSRREAAEFIYRTQVISGFPVEKYSSYVEEKFWNIHINGDVELEPVTQTASDQTIYEGFKFRLEIPNDDQNSSDVFYLNVKADTVSGSIYSRNINSGVETYKDALLTQDGYDIANNFITFYYGWWTYPSIMVDFHSVEYKGILDETSFTKDSDTTNPRKYSIEYLPIEKKDEFPLKTCLIKGDSGHFSSFKKTYYMPSHRAYSDINSPNNIQWLCSEEEAIAYGYTKALD